MSGGCSNVKPVQANSSESEKDGKSRNRDSEIHGKANQDVREVRDERLCHRSSTLSDLRVVARRLLLPRTVRRRGKPLVRDMGTAPARSVTSPGLGPADAVFRLSRAARRSHRSRPQ